MKVGVRVRHKKGGWIGTVDSFTKNGNGVYVRWVYLGYGGPYKLDAIEVVET